MSIVKTTGASFEYRFDGERSYLLSPQEIKVPYEVGKRIKQLFGDSVIVSDTTPEEKVEEALAGGDVEATDVEDITPVSDTTPEEKVEEAPKVRKTRTKKEE